MLPHNFPEPIQSREVYAVTTATSDKDEAKPKVTAKSHTQSSSQANPDVTHMTFAQYEAHILEEYKDVFSDELKEDPIQGAELKIHIKPDAIPHNISVPRATPIHLKDEADKKLKCLLEAGVIEKVPAGEPSQFCSHGFFKVKKETGKLRLLVDFSRTINPYVVRAPKPFASTRDII